MMGSERMPRVDDALHQVIGEVVTTELKDPRVGFVTITGVETSPDLKSARVFFSVLESDSTVEETIAGLDAAHGFIQRRIADQLRLKNTPKLMFLVDHTVEAANKIETLINDVEGAELGKPQAVTEREVLSAIEDNDSFVLLTHESMDGDALGSLIAMNGVLQLLGKDTVMLVAEAELPVSHELDFFDLSSITHKIPEDLPNRVAIYLDCGNIDRSPFAVVAESAQLTVNIDHHHDNTTFGDINHVVGSSSCTAEIVWNLMCELGVEPTLEVAQALYIGLVTDTGRFMYENTGIDAHEMAAELIEVGVDVHATYRRLFEDNPVSKLRLLGRGIENTVQLDNDTLIYTVLRREDFESSGASESYYEGVIDHLRAVEGAAVAALIRELPDGESRSSKKVSLRSTDGRVDVSVIARVGGGGGHRQAAGFSTDLEEAELVELLRKEIAAQLA